MEQGRIAAARSFGDESIVSNPSFYPYGIWTIPEISFLGKTEEQLTEEDVPYEVGVAYYREIARGQIRGDTTGRLKLIFHRETHALLGVHIIGEGASELVHIGQAVMTLGGKLDYFVETVFNYPTLAECNMVAAYTGLNRVVRVVSRTGKLDGLLKGNAPPIKLRIPLFVCVLDVSERAERGRALERDSLRPCHAGETRRLARAKYTNNNR